jgi:membrane protein required for colicin V production
VVACYRGFIKEAFSLLNWTIAFALSYLISPFLANAISGYFDSRLIVDIVTRTLIFTVSFVVFFLLTADFSRDLTESTNIHLNRFLGLCFGLIKSLLIFGLIFALYNCFFDYALGRRLVKKDSDKVPNWFKEAYSAPLISFSSDLLDPVVRGFIGILKINFSDTIKLEEKIDYKIDDIEKFKNNEIINEPLGIKKNNNPQQKNDLGYDKKDIEKMQRLIEIINQ